MISPLTVRYNTYKPGSHSSVPQQVAKYIFAGSCSGYFIHASHMCVCVCVCVFVCVCAFAYIF